MFHINFDVKALEELIKISDNVQGIADATAQGLAKGTHDKMEQIAQAKLNNRRAIFLDSLSIFRDPEGHGTYVLELAASARWVDEGLEKHSMLPGFLKSKKVKKAKDGSDYLIIPFQHKKQDETVKPTQAQADLISTLKSSFKMHGIPWGKIETKTDGSPRLGVLHQISGIQAPKGPSGISILEGVQVSQRQSKDKQGNDQTIREVTTFRTASSKHVGQKRWEHPGVAPANIFQETMNWLEGQWSTLAPQLLNSIAPG